MIRRVELIWNPRMWKTHCVKNHVSSKSVSSVPDVVQGPISWMFSVIVIIVGQLRFTSLKYFKNIGLTQLCDEFHEG